MVSPNDAYEIIKAQLEELTREQFIIVCLNIKNEPTNVWVVSVEILNKAIGNQIEMFKTALLSNTVVL